MDPCEEWQVGGSKYRPFAWEDVGLAAITREALFFAVPMERIFSSAFRTANTRKSQIEKILQTLVFAIKLGSVERHTLEKEYTSAED